jgi:hypothetical protein
MVKEKVKHAEHKQEPIRRGRYELVNFMILSTLFGLKPTAESKVY